MNVMKICKRCSDEFIVDDNLSVSPASELDEIFFEQTVDKDINDFCRQCIEELGMLNLLGFKR
jgi:hypothetical protein